MAKIFEENAYTKEIETRIKQIDTKNKEIELDDTIFYGKSGGQPGDVGQIIADGQKLEVNDTIKRGESIINILENLNGLSKNQKIIARINWDKRYKYMRMHSALHLMCASINLGVTGGQISYDKSRLDFNDPDKEIIKEQLQEKINTLMKENHEITYKYMDRQILENQPELVRTMSVRPPNIDGELRFVKIGNIDFQPCGGTHVKSTKEIGKITIGKIENKGRMNRRVNILIND